MGLCLWLSTRIAKQLMNMMRKKLKWEELLQR